MFLNRCKREQHSGKMFVRKLNPLLYVYDRLANYMSRLCVIELYLTFFRSVSVKPGFHMVVNVS